MPIDERAEKEAKDELLQIKEEWRKRLENIRETQVSPREAKTYREHIWMVRIGFRDRYGPYISNDLFHESIQTIEAIATDVSIALRKGQENYDMGKHNRRINWARATGLGVILGMLIAAIIFLIGKLVFNIEIPLCR
jgi:hypothetical protein